jgi:hypothetical protein
LAAAGKIPRFFYRVLQNAQKRDKENRAKQPRRKKTEGEKKHFL